MELLSWTGFFEILAKTLEQTLLSLERKEKQRGRMEEGGGERRREENEGGLTPGDMKEFPG